jgi:hypothetical protein
VHKEHRKAALLLLGYEIYLCAATALTQLTIEPGVNELQNR